MFSDFRPRRILRQYFPTFPEEFGDMPEVPDVEYPLEPDDFAADTVSDIAAQLEAVLSNLDPHTRTQGLRHLGYDADEQEYPIYDNDFGTPLGPLPALSSLFDLLGNAFGENANDDLPPLPAFVNQSPLVLPEPPEPTPTVPHAYAPLPTTPSYTPPTVHPLPELPRAPAMIDVTDPAEMGRLYDDLAALTRRGIALVQARGALVPAGATTATGAELRDVIAQLRTTLVTADALHADVTRFAADVVAIETRVDAMLATRRRMQAEGFSRPDRLAEITDIDVRGIYAWIKSRDHGYPRWYRSAVRVSTDTVVWAIPRISGLPQDEEHVHYAIGPTGELISRTVEGDNIINYRTYRNGAWQVNPR